MNEDFDKAVINEFNQILDTDVHILNYIEDELYWIEVEGFLSDVEVVLLGAFVARKVKKIRSNGPVNKDGIDFYDWE